MEAEDCSDEVGVVCGRVVMLDGASFGGDTIIVPDDPAFDDAWEFVSMATSSLRATDTGVSSSSLAVVGVASGETVKTIFYLRRK